jgi:hypothetical protein
LCGYPGLVGPSCASILKGLLKRVVAEFPGGTPFDTLEGTPTGFRSILGDP